MKSYLYIVFISCMSLVISAQDEQFSQFYALPMHINPALTGAYDGTYRMTAVYRDQWNSALESPYKTFAAGGDTRLNVNIGKLKTKDSFGVGLYFVSDKVSEFQHSTSKLSSYFAYHKHLGKKSNSFLGAGMKLGIIQRNISYDRLTFEDQFNQTNGYEGLTSESLPPNNFGKMDISLGINYAFLGEKSSYYIGAAIHHVTEPNFSFFNGQSTPNPAIDISQTLTNKTVFHASIDKQLKYRMSLQPRIVYQQQGENSQLALGTNLDYRFKESNNSFLVGLWVTAVDDLDNFHPEKITPLIGIGQGQFLFGLSYDIHFRDSFDSSFGFNAFEFSIRFSGEYEESGVHCPTF